MAIILDLSKPTVALMIQDVRVMQKLHTDNFPQMVGRKKHFSRVKKGRHISDYN